MREPPRGVITAACVLLLVLAAVQVRLPLFVERPLAPLALSDALEVDGRPAAELDGGYLVGLVGRRRASVVTAAVAVVRGDQRLRRAAEVIPPGLDDEAYRERRRQVFARSVDEAASAALAALGRSVPQRTEGVLVVDVVGGSPADGRLEGGDVIVALGGEPVASPVELEEAVDEADGGVRLTVERDGESHTVRVRPAPFEAAGASQVGLGVVTSPAPPRMDLPVDVAVDDDEVGGASAGLVLALAVLDVLDEERALAAGRRVAGTGRVGAEGRVGSVSGVARKVRGAVEVGADVFVVPHEQRAEAERAAGDALEVLGVGHLEEAVEALVSGGRSGSREEAAPRAVPAG